MLTRGIKLADERTEDDLLDIGDMAGAPFTQMFPRGCQKLNMPAGGM
jgi:hypothetical protein